MAENLREQINAALTRVAVLDDCLRELRNDMPTLPQVQTAIASRVHWICELLEREAEELDRFLLGAGSHIDSQRTEQLHP